MICNEESLAKIRVVARARAKHLVEAYDVDPDAREAFMSDLVIEIVDIARAFLKAADEVQARNAALFVSQAQNRAMRRKAESLLRAARPKV